MNQKIKYQYSYFIHPYVIEKNEYEKYLMKLVRNKKCSVHFFRKEKDLNLYTYFLPVIRDYMFESFSLTDKQVRDFSTFDEVMKTAYLSKKNCVMFDYELGNAQGKVGDKKGIFFDIPEIKIVCFKTGVCFLIIKTILDGTNKLSDVLNFNYKFRDINSDFISLQDYENINIQTADLKDINDLSKIVTKITGKDHDAKELNLNDERFITYSYACIAQENWNDKTKTEELENDFMKFANILPSSHQINVDYDEDKVESLKNTKYTRFGATKQGTVLLTSSISTDNYTKLPYAFEREYLYTYILALYKKIYMKKLSVEFGKKNRFENTKQEFLEFSNKIWISEITDDSIGSDLYAKWSKALGLKNTFADIKEKYDIAYKDMNFDKNNKVTAIIGGIFVATLLFNVVNFILLSAK